MAQVDAQVDLARFDNDGPDGRPASGDDDGVVDYIFLLLPRVPRGFLVDGATGFAGLGLAPAFTTGDAGSDGEMVEINGSRYRGAILQARSFATTVGIMAHELGHGFDLPDLYDVGYDSPETDSAGIGRWGLMGHGSTGWRGDDGPNPFSAWSLEQLGWIGDNNDGLIDVTDDVLDAHLTNPRTGGNILRIPLRTQFMAPGAVFAQEYLLLEYRGHGTHYDRHLPAEGLLVWHVRPQEGGNTNESHKLVDLICADAATIDMIDDLDHWAHDGSFASAHGGNVGDATDPFDGRHFDRLELATGDAASSGLTIDLRETDDGMNIDVRLPRWSGTIDGDVEWMGQIFIDGDLTVAPQASLTIYPDTQVRVAGDRTQSGIDPRRSELRIEGKLTVSGARLTRWGRRSATAMSVGPVVLQSDVIGDTWFGVIADTTSLLNVPAGSMLIRDAQTEEINRLEDVTAASVATAITAEHVVQPGAFELLPNYPNPFNPTTTIAFHLAQPQVVEIVLFDVLGQRVRRLFHGSAPTGRSDVTWDGRDDAGRSVASGVYVCLVSTDDGTRISRPMTLAR
jgi:M6 family metalloprotease-like protein